MAGRPLRRARENAARREQDCTVCGRAVDLCQCCPDCGAAEDCTCAQDREDRRAAAWAEAARRQHSAFHKPGTWQYRATRKNPQSDFGNSLTEAKTNFRREGKTHTKSSSPVRRKIFKYECFEANEQLLDSGAESTLRLAFECASKLCGDTLGPPLEYPGKAQLEDVGVRLRAFYHTLVQPPRYCFIYVKKEDLEQASWSSSMRPVPWQEKQGECSRRPLYVRRPTPSHFGHSTCPLCFAFFVSALT